MSSKMSAPTNGVDTGRSQESELAGVLDAYLAAVEAGRAIDPEVLAAAHPEIADRLLACLSVLRVASQVEGRTDASAAIDAATDTCLGDFRILRMIGRGGMGIVFEAEQVSLHRRVALKVLPFAAALDPQQLRRFEIEAQAAAQLHHTNIVPIFSVGCERGVHYYAMQHIEGQTLAALIRDLRQIATVEGPSGADATGSGHALAAEIVTGRFAPPPETCAPSANGIHDRAFLRTVAYLGLQAAEALDHAHRLGIIHRDIKPANLLVDVRGNLWITDFGLARMQADSSLTMTGDIVGTLRYTSPEQSAARRGIVDHRTDVYSLGATLYELLTLHPAYDGRDRAELLHQMAFGEPKPPRTWNPAIPRDLETIVLKALTKDVQNRYASARDLADDLRRFVEQRSIQARRPSLWNRASKWARRHKSLVASAIAILMLVAAASAIITTQARSNQRLDRITRHAQYVHDIRQAFHLVRQNGLPDAIHLLSRHCPAPGEQDDRSFPWYYLWRLCHFRPTTFQGHEGEVYHVEFSPDGQTVASSGQDGTVRLWDAATGRTRRILRGHDGDVNYVTFSADGRTLATGGDDGTVRLWDAASGKLLSTLGKHADWVTCVLFTPDGQRLISGGREGILKVWEIKTGQERSFPSHGWHIEGMALSPDGQTLVTGGWDNSAKFWDLASLRVKMSLDVHSRVQSVAFSHDGRSVASADRDRTVKVWDAESGQLKTTLRGHTDQVECVRFSPDDRTLASCAGDGTVRLWEITPGRLRKQYRGHDGRVWCVAFSPDGRTLASCGADARVNLWDLSTSQDRISVPIPGQAVRSIAFPTGGGRSNVFALDGPDGVIMDLDLGRGEMVDRRRIHSRGSIVNGVLSPDGERLATATLDEIVTLWDIASGLPRKSVPVPAINFVPENGASAFGEMTFSPEGRFLAITKPRDGVLLWDTENGAERQFPRFDYITVKFLPRAEGILVYSADGLMRGDMATGKYRPSLLRGGHRLGCLALSVDGRMMATGEEDGTIKLWDVRDLEHEATLFGHGGTVTSLAWSPDGKVLASRGGDQTVRLWDVSARQELGIIEDSEIKGLNLIFSPDDSILAGYGGESMPEVVLWPAARDENPRR